MKEMPQSLPKSDFRSLPGACDCKLNWSNKLSAASKLVGRTPLHFVKELCNTVKPLCYNIFNILIRTPKGSTEPSVRFTEVSFRIIEVGNVAFLAFLGPNELSVIEWCPYYRGVPVRRGLTVSRNIHPHMSSLTLSLPKLVRMELCGVLSTFITMMIIIFIL